MKLAQDSDYDGLPDAWEMEFFGSLTQSAYDDYDGDGLLNIIELKNNLNPNNTDTDGDQINDAYEVDTDADGLSDGTEIFVQGTSPFDPDTDGDGWTDGDEVNVYLTDPLDPNSHP
jgi:hypothetical protein